MTRWIRDSSTILAIMDVIRISFEGKDTSREGAILSRCWAR